MYAQERVYRCGSVCVLSRHIIQVSTMRPVSGISFGKSQDNYSGLCLYRSRPSLSALRLLFFFFPSIILFISNSSERLLTVKVEGGFFSSLTGLSFFLLTVTSQEEYCKIFGIYKVAFWAES